jgi:hypothetical protein
LSQKRKEKEKEKEKENDNLFLLLLLIVGAFGWKVVSRVPLHFIGDWGVRISSLMHSRELSHFNVTMADPLHGWKYW